MSTRTATILTRTEPQTKEAADAIFARLGLTTSGAINIFLHQSIEEQGMPFQIRLAKPNIPDLDEMPQSEVDELIKEGLDDVKSGHTRPAKEVFASLMKKYDLAR